LVGQNYIFLTNRMTAISFCAPRWADVVLVLVFIREKQVTTIKFAPDFAHLEYWKEWSQKQSLQCFPEKKPVSCQIEPPTDNNLQLPELRTNAAMSFSPYNPTLQILGHSHRPSIIFIRPKQKIYCTSNPARYARIPVDCLISGHSGAVKCRPFLICASICPKRSMRIRDHAFQPSTTRHTSSL